MTHQPHHFALRPLVLLVHAALLCASLPAAAQSAAPASAHSSEQRYEIAAAPLAEALSRFAGAAGVTLAFDAAQLSGLRSQGLQGSYTVAAGFARLLEGSGFDAVPNGAARFSLKKRPPSAASDKPEPQLAAVTVRAGTEASPQTEGKASAGYRSKTLTSLGALGSRSLQETPFAVSVIPQELIENTQAQSADDIYKISPSTRTITAQNTGWSPAVSIRGFTSYDTAEDGLRRPYNHAAVVEDKARVEVLNGLSGFLYGAAAPGGMVNYVYKRPTAQRYNSVTLGNYGGSQNYVHGDFGGPIDADGDTRYRLNVVKQEGNTAVDEQSISRELVSGAFDWDLTDKLLLEVNAVYNHYKTQSPSAYWFYSIPRGAAPDVSKNWSQAWALDEVTSTKFSNRLTYLLNEHITLRGAYSYNVLERPETVHTLNSVSSTAGYEQLAYRGGQSKSNYEAAQALADIQFDTAAISHKLTLGHFMFSEKAWTSSYFSGTGWLGPYSFATPTHIAQPAFPNDSNALYYAGRDSNRNYVIGDSIKLNQQWSALVGITRSTITSKTLAEDGSETQAQYKKSRNSPSLSLVFTPISWLSTYASYIEGLEIGGRAPDTASNAKEVMPAMVSKQKELGIKATLGEMQLTSALFEIEKAYEYTGSDNIYTQNGRQNHKGIELTATGKANQKLTLLGGVTLLDTQLKGGDYSGKKPINVADFVAKLYAEYELPVTGLSVSSGIYYTGKQWADEANTDRLPAYTTLDLGLRYTLNLQGKPLTLRVNVNNVEGKNYWANSYYVGAPRSIAFSAQYQF
ncbi:TonB-dependent receptor [Uliginosibacterium sediminicola]|uniref:TonB-dependent receptor n=1 Tax=Uliginosibacterium sediminicola TaxID=2024550 RepID=A0ABU9YVJ1_9RHOO